MSKILPYDPGVLPVKPPPRPGEALSLEMDGYPPFMDLHFSIRNPRHRIYSRSVALRDAALKAMAGRAPFRGRVGLDFVLHAPKMETGKEMIAYVGGIMDTLDGSHGVEFTCLPVVYEDDCQVALGSHRLLPSDSPSYRVVLTFLQERGKRTRRTVRRCRAARERHRWGST